MLRKSINGAQRYKPLSDERRSFKQASPIYLQYSTLFIMLSRKEEPLNLFLYDHRVIPQSKKYPNCDNYYFSVQ